MPANEISFQNNGIHLTGNLYLPEGAEPWQVVVVIHAASFGRRTDACYRHLIEQFPPLGIGVFVFDRRGCGQSDGDFETASFDDLAEDAHWAIRAVANQPRVDRGQFCLYGISQGGWIAPLAAANKTLWAPG